MNVRILNAVLVDVGTGWLPVLPLSFAFAGARRCHTFDVARHLNTRLTSRAIARLRAHLPRIADTAGISLEDTEQRYAYVSGARDVSGALWRAGVRYYAAADAAAHRSPA